MGLLRIFRIIPIKKSERQVEHISAGFLNRGLRGTRNLSSERFQVFEVAQNWQTPRVGVGRKVYSHRIMYASQGILRSPVRGALRWSRCLPHFRPSPNLMTDPDRRRPSSVGPFQLKAGTFKPRNLGTCPVGLAAVGENSNLHPSVLCGDQGVANDVEGEGIDRNVGGRERGFIEAHGSYTTSMRVTGFIELADPLPSNLGDTIITTSVLSFSFFDGVQTHNDTSSFTYRLFRVQTDASGNIKEWDVSLWYNPPIHFVSRIDLNSSAYAHFQADLVGYEQSTASTGPVSVRPWSLRASPVPEIPSLTLLGIGLAGLAVRLRKRRIRKISGVRKRIRSLTPRPA